MSFEYSKLNKTQKRVIDAFIQLRPELASASTITRPEIEDLFQQLFTARSSGGEKIGYPMWMTKQARVGRGVYAFPGPNASVSNKPAVITVAMNPKQKAAEDEEFMSELQEAGVQI